MFTRADAYLGQGHPEGDAVGRLVELGREGLAENALWLREQRTHINDSPAT
jgi:hypothetical protein